MPALTNGSVNLVLNFLMTANAVTRPTALHVAVGTGSSATGLSGEPSGNGYARQLAAFTVSGTSSTNSATVTFGPCTGTAWGTLSDVAIFDAATGGNCVWRGPLAASKTVAVGDSLQIAASGLSVSLS
jgi:hypothetical protein